ncbi:hypothetical protein ACFOU2_18950 [Bacillus songklensis]|uniref:Uncharacterized protein n=1 Tax=Bacillus songklensis TaxID=1069116 RepID=A0ABV8B7G5_9BACI
MPEHKPEVIEQNAKDEEHNARKATAVVNDAISHMVPQRHYDEDKSRNKR